MDQVHQRSRLFEPVENLHGSLEKIGLDTKYRYVPMWRLMSKFVLAMQGDPDWQETSTAREYQATKLGHADGDSFLTELMPLPKPNLAAWPYESIFPDKKDYFKEIRPKRMAWLRSEFTKFQPRYVICYGKGYWPYYQEIFSNVTFDSELIENVLIGQRAHSTIIMTRFLSPDLVSPALLGQIAEILGQNHN
ncbi:MAG: hypothetical protein CMJ45_08115 [Planctomyces sp.]|nr:hypothetical protein [Planctomyces sp.]